MEFTDLLYHHALAFEDAALFYYDKDELQNLHQTLNNMVNSLRNGGKLIFVGCGKSYKIICKTVAMLTSMGIPARDLHPIEAMHGDMGCCQPNDSLIFCSTSGETDEVLNLLRYLKAGGSYWEKCIRIAVTGNRNSTLATHCQHTIVVPQADRFKEPKFQRGLRAPTISTSLMVTVLDCICIEISKAWFGNDPVKREIFFNERHPGGGIGKITSSTNLTQLVRAPTDYQTPQYHSYMVKRNETLTETQFLSLLITFDYIQFSPKNVRVPTCLLREEHKRAVHSGTVPEWFRRYL
ncbi:SIS domain-containing protein [Kluyveromyces lactis]|uniref:KLLA0E03719p n=1 Tax=Kluyveromyces lactis (strain ATCC 8585 / CBS 2359 / DSM 70799 / NBRC 1267 / NRRL Y-1140 / WM37) TaxID=284590 RepID=Q6CPM7_KLULA|nr:uncharacterized protein KLLA0_E03719g [Kluyveromyces lactis]CAG99199.1 KLLA0E03719p [Kluyveromyces lactis]|eukprot:XP_454112.1 uncharacterized protein KLLA0_E03719g [Kluyveromyces lactis]